MGHVNIPIFIPHLGCPNQCIFCNQRYISGTVEFDESNVRVQIEQALATIEGKTAEIAFFGGSFTGIDRDLMVRLLNLAESYIADGKVSGIRMSTRPDYISDEILDILQNYTISCVELGIQTLNDEVLRFLKRGHTSKQTENAIRLLKSRNIPFVGQMMIGLPMSSAKDELDCAEFICKNGACGCRIYPTLVFRNTELEQITKQSIYKPLDLDEAVDRSAMVLGVFVRNNVPCLRIGLCESDNLHLSSTFVAGPNHPSIGEMVKGRLYLELIIKELRELNKPRHIIVEHPKGTTSQIIGNKRKNLLILKNIYGVERVTLVENDTLNAYEIKIFNKED